MTAKPQTEIVMTHASLLRFTAGPAQRPHRQANSRLVAVAALFIFLLLLAAAVLIVRAAPVLDPAALIYVT